MCLTLTSVCNKDSNIWGQVGQNSCRLHSTRMRLIQNLQKGLFGSTQSSASDSDLCLKKYNRDSGTKREIHKKVFALLVQQQRMECAVTSGKDIVKLKPESVFVPT